MNIKTLAVSIVLLCCTSIAMAQEAPPAPVEDVFFDQLLGTWQGAGQFMGSECTNQDVIAWVLDHQFIQWSWSVTCAEEGGGSMTHSGIAYYRPAADGTYNAHLFDCTGTSSSFTSTVEGNAITDHVEGEMGMTRIVNTLSDDGTSLTAQVYGMAEDGTEQMVGQVVSARQ